ncbi:MAG: hypothetical protein AAF218_06565 [Pseudomonadota bacterium]
MYDVIVDGPLRLKNAQHLDVTPRGKKTRGLLALLAFSKEFRRSRSWLQDRLWSDRGHEQAAASLRQSLSELRKCLDTDAPALLAENGCVQLNPDLFRVNADDITDPMSLLEDLDIRDAGFEAWLADLKAGLSRSLVPRDRNAPPRRPTVVFGLHHEADDHLGLVNQLKSNAVRSLLEVGNVNVTDMEYINAQPAPLEGPSLFVRIHSFLVSGTISVRATIETLSGSSTIWQTTVEAIPNDPAIDDATIWRLRAAGQALVARIMEEVITLEAQDDARPLAMALFARAYKTMFGFRRCDLIEADRLLKAAYEIEPHGTYLSWRAFVRSTAAFEHLTDDFLEPCNVAELHETALRDDPANSNALIFAARDSFVSDGDSSFGMMLVDKALEKNPSNPLGWGFRSNMLILENRFAEAVHAAERGIRLAEGQPMFPTMSIFCSMARIANEELKQAELDARAGVMTGSKCQALRRYLFALYSVHNKPEQAKIELGILRQREADFTPQHLLMQSYPLQTLQSLKFAELLPT